MLKKVFKKIAYLKRKKEPVVFFDLPSGEKKRVIKKAIHMANKEQRDLMDNVSREEWGFSCKN